MILTSPNINGIRILSNYFSLFIISFATYLVLTDLRRIPYNLFVYIVYIWGIVGLIQLFYPTFLSFLTLRGAYGGPTYGRGVSSLAVEPTFYGMICVFLMMINYINFRNMPKYKFTKLVCIIQLIFFFPLHHMLHGAYIGFLLLRCIQNSHFPLWVKNRWFIRHNFTIGASLTTYICWFFRLPIFQRLTSYFLRSIHFSNNRLFCKPQIHTCIPDNQRFF